MAETWQCKYAAGCPFTVTHEGAMNDAQLDLVRAHVRDTHQNSGPTSSPVPPTPAPSVAPAPNPEATALAQAIGQAVLQALSPITQTISSMAIAVQDLRSDMASVRRDIDEAKAGSAPQQLVNGVAPSEGYRPVQDAAQAKPQTMLEVMMQLAMQRFMSPAGSGGFSGSDPLGQATKQFEAMGTLLKGALGFAQGIAQEVRMGDQAVIKSVTDIIMASARSGAEPLEAVAELNRRATASLEVKPPPLSPNEPTA